MLPTRTTCLLLTATALTPLATAQTYEVAPATYANDDAIAFNWIAGASREVRQQILVGEAHLQNLIGEDLLAFEFRRTAKNETYAAGACQMTVQLSISPRDPVETAAQLSANVGPNPIQVFNGQVDFPNSPPEPGPTVAWTADNTVRVPFTTAYTYNGGTLCIDIVGIPIAGQQANWWMADAMFEDVPGTTTDLGGGCGAYGGPSRAWAHVDERSLTVGGNVHMSAYGDPFGFAIAAIGQSNTVGTPLWMLGFPADPSCQLHLSTLDSLMPAVFMPDPHPSLVNRGGRADLYLQVPANTMLLGASLTTQWFDWNQVATSNAIEWTLASQVPTLDMALVEAHPTQTHGQVTNFIAPVLRFEYQ